MKATNTKLLELAMQLHLFPVNQIERTVQFLLPDSELSRSRLQETNLYVIGFSVSSVSHEYSTTEHEA
jgi:hypothetical protein